MKTRIKNQIDKVVSEFDREVISKAYEKISSDPAVFKSIEDFPDPGEETPATSRISKENMSFQEAVIGDPDFLPVSFLEEGATVQRAIGRVSLSRGKATGFMVSPTLFITNNHVIANKAVAKTAKAQFGFQTDMNGNDMPTDDYKFDPESVFYTNENLDFTLIRLAKKCNYNWDWNWRTTPYLTNNSEYTPTPFGPANGNNVNDLIPTTPIRTWKQWNRVCQNAGDKWGYVKLNNSIAYGNNTAHTVGTKINIIQHPQGRRKEVALQKNELKAIFSNAIRYSTDTDYGSSGSPVFNNLWDLIALHHARSPQDSSGNWVTNQGIRIDRIIADLKTHFDGSATGLSILAELGLNP